MVKPKISVAAIGAALIAVLAASLTWPGEAQQRGARAAQYSDAVAAPVRVANNAPYYDAGMRIIHVPQPGEAVANYPADNGETAAKIDNEIEIALPPPKRKRIATPAPPQPRRILPPPTTGPRRAVLSAPPPAAEGPTPIRPLPRWRPSEKFTIPGEAAPVVAPAENVTAAAPLETSAPVNTSDPAVIDDDSPPPAD
jgi:hypothetical protein